MKGYFYPSLVTIVAAQCLAYENVHTSAASFEYQYHRSLEGNPIRPLKVNFLSFRWLGNNGTGASSCCTSTAANTFSIPSPPIQLPETEKLDLAMLSFLKSEILMGSSIGYTCVHVL